MTRDLPIKLLELLSSAPPKVYATVCGVVGYKAESGRQRAEIDSEEEEPGSARQGGQLSLDVLRGAFALLQKLDLDAPLKAPSALTVFRLYCVDGLSAKQVARKCHCSKSTVIGRLRFIEEKTKTKAAEFRASSGHLQAIDEEYRKSGAREIYRRGLAQEGGEDE